MLNKVVSFLNNRYLLAIIAGLFLLGMFSRYRKA